MDLKPTGDIQLHRHTAIRFLCAHGCVWQYISWWLPKSPRTYIPWPNKNSIENLNAEKLPNNWIVSLIDGTVRVNRTQTAEQLHPHLDAPQKVISIASWDAYKTCAKISGLIIWHLSKSVTNWSPEAAPPDQWAGLEKHCRWATLHLSDANFQAWWSFGHPWNIWVFPKIMVPNHPF